MRAEASRARAGAAASNGGRSFRRRGSTGGRGRGWRGCVGRSGARSRGRERGGRGLTAGCRERGQCLLGRMTATTSVEETGFKLFRHFCFCFVLFFVISFLLFIFFSVLFQFKLFRHFIKMCLPHHIYLCKIWHLPNIFILIFENFCRLTYLGFKFETVLN